MERGKTIQGHRQRLAGVSTPPPLPAYTGAREVRAVKRLRYVRLSAGRRAAIWGVFLLAR